MNERQRLWLRSLAAGCTRERDWLSAARLHAYVWNTTPTHLRRSLTTSRGIARILSNLLRQGMVERQWNAYRAVWEYRPSEDGWREARQAGWLP